MANPNPFDPALWASLQKDAFTLRFQPNNQTLRTKILQDQVTLTGRQLQIGDEDAADYVRTVTVLYAQTKGYDPDAVMRELTEQQQKIMNWSPADQKILGMSLPTALIAANYFAAAAGIVLTASIMAFIVAALVLGAEGAAAIGASGSVLAAFAATLRVATAAKGAIPLAIGGFLFLLSQWLGRMAEHIPMVTNQLVDMGAMVPNMTIGALKDVATLQAKLDGSSAPGPYSASAYDKLYNGFLAAGINGVVDPESKNVVPITRQSLAKAINAIYGRRLISGLSVTQGGINGELRNQLRTGVSVPQIPLSLYDQVAAVPATPSATVSPLGILYTPTQSAAPPASAARVFVGVVAQGVVQSTTPFIARPNDLIEDIGELQDAAQNNLAAVVAALPGSLVYEIKVVPTITTRDGFTQRGKTQQIRVGTFASGKPKYRTIVNKFAVLSVFVVNDRGARTKLRTITLGPVDSLRFQPTTADLENTEKAVKRDLISNDSAVVGDAVVVSGSPQPTTAITPSASVGGLVSTGGTFGPTDAQLAARLSPTPVTVQYPTAGMFRAVGNIGDQILRRVGNRIYVFNLFSLIKPEEGARIGNAGAQAREAGVRLRAQTGIEWERLPQYNLGDLSTDPSVEPSGPQPREGGPLPFIRPVTTLAEFLALGPSVAAGSQSAVLNAPQGQSAASGTWSRGNMSATSLKEWYDSWGVVVPSVEERSLLYEQYELGSAGLYVGTVEQNTKLLAELKMRAK